MPLPDAFKKKMQIQDSSTADSSSVDSSEVDSADAAVPAKKGKKAANPLMAWADSRK